MILCSIDDCTRFSGISPQLDFAFKWVREHYGEPFVRGCNVIGQSPAGNDILAKSEEPALLPREKVSLEAHRRYIDIQLPLKGPEKMGWASVSGLKLPRAEYDDKNDVIFFGDSATSLFNVRPGQMAVFFPEDAHGPNIGLGTHRKLIIKVPVD